MKHLLTFHMEIWDSANEQQTGFLALSLFFSNEDIKVVLDYFALLTLVERVAALISHNPCLDNLQIVAALYSVICDLQMVFDNIAAEKKQKAWEK